MTQPASELDRLSAALSDRFTIEHEIGRGGMATVYLARDRKHARRVALKVLRPELSSAMGVDRFPREIQIIAQMQHPHILPLHDSGEAAGFLYYVMPFIDGETLRTRLKRGPLGVTEGVRLMTEIVDALAYAHRAGVMHRDIKPDNVMLSGKHAIVTDFGIAKAVERSATDKLTTVGIAVGTPQYMAPEQAMGQSDVDHRADIYAIGVLGYEILTGRPVFEAATAQGLLSAHVLEAPKDVRERKPEVPALLAEALLRCLAKEPTDRWQSADDLLAQLEQVVATPSGGLTPTTTRPFNATSGRRSSGKARWLSAGAMLIIAGAAIAFVLLNGGGGQIERIGVMPIEDISGKDSLFTSAMQDALTTALSRTGVGVASRSAMMRYKAGDKSTRDIAVENDLDAVVETTVFRAGDVMRISVMLRDPVTTKALWSDMYEKNVTNVLAAQSEVVGKVSAGIDSVLNAHR